MGVEPSDVTLLVMAWAMGAARMGYLTREEWTSAIPRLGGAGTALALQEELRSLHKSLLRDIERFRELHAYTHRFCREGTRKTIDVRRRVDVPRATSAHREPFLFYPRSPLPDMCRCRPRW